MTHLPYIAVSYGLTLAIGLALGLGAWRRLRATRARLAALDPRAHSTPRGQPAPFSRKPS